MRAKFRETGHVDGLELEVLNMHAFTLMRRREYSQLLNTLNTVSALSTQNVLVYALPKLKEARIVSIDKSVPTGCSIRTYRGFVEYWRTTVSAQLVKDFF